MELHSSASITRHHSQVTFIDTVRSYWWKSALNEHTSKMHLVHVVTMLGKRLGLAEEVKKSQCWQLRKAPPARLLHAFSGVVLAGAEGTAAFRLAKTLYCPPAVEQYPALRHIHRIVISYLESFSAISSTRAARVVLSTSPPAAAGWRCSVG